MNSKRNTNLFTLLFLLIFQFIFCQEIEYDSLKNLQRIDSLKNEIKKDCNNYEAIREYYFQKNDPIFTSEDIPKFYDSLFALIEKNKKIRPEFFSLRADIFYSRGYERAKIFKKGFSKFPKDYRINVELGNYYHNEFIETENKNNKKTYADSARIHLENNILKHPSQTEKIINAVLLYQIYNFQNENGKMKKIERKIFSKSFQGIQLNTFLRKDDLKTDKKADFKVSSFLNSIENLMKYKDEFYIKSKSNIFFNFILYRSFFKPILFSLEKIKGKYFISYFVSNKVDEIKRPFETSTIEIKKEEYQLYLNLLTNKNIVKSSVALNPGYDGSSWYLESKTKKSHTLQELWAPNIDCQTEDANCAVIKACLYLIKLSGLKTISRKIDSVEYEYNSEEEDGYMIW